MSAGHGEAPGIWTGGLAKHLGIEGQVTPEAFRAVLSELHPETGERLKWRPNTKVAAWDVTFSPPKSISTLWAIAPPHIRETIHRSHLNAMAAGLEYLEQHACVARLGRGGSDPQPGLGFIAAAFTHRTSREGDPQLHTHAVIANLTETADGRRAALDGAMFWPQRFAADAVYQTALRAELTRDLGLGYVQRGGFWEIDGIPAALNRHFSKRRTHIQQQLVERGTSGGRAAQAAALATRKPKPDTAPTGELLHDRFTREARTAGHHPGQILADTLHQHRLSGYQEDDDQHGTQADGDGDRWPNASSGLGRLPYAPDPDTPADLWARLHTLATAHQRDGRQPGADVGPAASAVAGDVVDAVVETLVGPEGLTEKASSFARRDILTAAAHQLPHHPAASALMQSAAEARQLLERIADRVLADPRVIPLLNPQARTSGEVIRPRGRDGRTLREVRTHVERRYSTVDLLAAEHELLTRATTRQNDRSAPVIAAEHVEQALAAFPELDGDQQTMVRTIATSGAGVDVVVGKAGTGKTTAIRCLKHAADSAGVPMLGVAPSATAAHQLAHSASIQDSTTIHRLLADLEHGHRRLPPRAIVMVDEAAMVDTRHRLRLQQAIDALDGKVVDVGDHRQLPSVDVGGIHQVLATKLGALTLGINHRFGDPAYRDAAELIREGHADKGIEQLRALNAVYEHDRAADTWTAMVNDWLCLGAAGDDVLMLADERAAVAALNQLARHHLIQSGHVARRGRRYVSDDDTRDIELAPGDQIVLRRNDARLPQPDGTTATVRNGMTGTVVATNRRSVTVELDPDHQDPDGPATITLPASYVGAYVDHGYARTVHTAQGATTDHTLYAPSPAASAESAYVALSRGRHTNRIYATTNNGWTQAITTTRTHTPAIQQKPNRIERQDQRRRVQHPDQTRDQCRAQPEGPSGGRSRTDRRRSGPAALGRDARARRRNAVATMARQPVPAATRLDDTKGQLGTEPKGIDLVL